MCMGSVATLQVLCRFIYMPVHIYSYHAVIIHNYPCMTMQLSLCTPSLLSIDLLDYINIYIYISVIVIS